MVRYILSTFILLILFSFPQNILAGNKVCCLPSSSEDCEKKKPFYLLLKAKDKQGHSALFVPSEHGFPWNELPKWYKDKVLSRKVGVVEMIESKETHEAFRRLVSKEKLPPEIFLKQKPWSFPHEHAEFQEQFTHLAHHFKEKGYDYSYLEDISHVPPGLLAFLCCGIFNPYQDTIPDGMDNKIESIFSSSKSKEVAALESPQDFMDCFGLYSATYKDVEEDFCLDSLKRFLNPPSKDDNREEITEFGFYDAPYPCDFKGAVQALEKEVKEELKEPSLTAFDESVNKRNKKWLGKILFHVHHDNRVIVAGLGHFFGSEGLLSLAQAEGLGWQYYDPLVSKWINFEYPLIQTSKSERF